MTQDPDSPPPLPGSVPPPLPPPPGPPSLRYHHLDALRAVAMLLGIVIHGALSFMSLPVWPAQDIDQNDAFFGFLKDIIHGFRMPLFFLISGFFTTMLWQKRGASGLIQQRTMRILIPLLIGICVLWPVVIGIAIWGGHVKEKNAEQRGEGALTIWEAARVGNLEVLREILSEKDERKLKSIAEARDHLRISPLEWAAMHGQTDAVDLLVEAGADVNPVNHEGNTPIHSASFFGRSETVTRLVGHGADVGARNKNGETPLDSASSDEWLIEYVGELLSMDVDKEEVEKGREKTRKYLVSVGGKSGARSGDGSEDGKDGRSGGEILWGIFYMGAFAPVFHHLWFLYYLLWLLAGFLLITALLRRCGWKAPPRWMISAPWCLLWVVPLTWAAQLFMQQSFGPDTATGVIPWPPKLIYYAVFFFYGSLCFGRKDWMESAGRRWYLWIAAAVPVFVLGKHFFEERNLDFDAYNGVVSLCAGLYAWFMIFALIGIFRRFFSSTNPKIRYISDASYWLYLAHLPAIMIVQIIVSDWPWPAFLKFVLVCGVTTGVLLLAYEYLVRYSPIGTMLNGKKVRPEK